MSALPVLTATSLSMGSWTVTSRSRLLPNQLSSLGPITVSRPFSNDTSTSSASWPSTSSVTSWVSPAMTRTRPLPIST